MNDYDDHGFARALGWFTVGLWGLFFLLTVVAPLIEWWGAQ